MRTFHVPFGRLNELKQRPDAELLLYKPGRGAFDDYRVIRFATRKALEAFNKKAGLKAIIPTQKPLNCAVWAHETDAQARQAAE